MKVQMICNYCGGTNVMRDAWAVWDARDEKWVLGAVFDAAHCDDCERETSIDEQPLVPTT